MPHITVDYAAPLAYTFDRHAFGRELHSVIEKTIDASAAACRTRFRRIEECVIADGAEDIDMVHIEVAIHAGRSPEAKAGLAEAVMELARAQLPAAGRQLHTSVHITDLDPRAYVAHKTGKVEHKASKGDKGDKGETSA
ncbi:5-carboxymethyl-2-hydroxymuconate Delta-isomerase [Streptomyces gobiensis]|uniref:5-carboxymethyl-2-hydroxymuconate Delta-isomerase n=1 Tax=Streptomyces gobiensis TaxID=2875706 RepID=UPI001E5687D7|nr:isomerase [Streptomyces gobiensis]UGY91021.1 isomerase [Streptomyces gobiensis]